MDAIIGFAFVMAPILYYIYKTRERNNGEILVLTSTYLIVSCVAAALAHWIVGSGYSWIGFILVWLITLFIAIRVE